MPVKKTIQIRRDTAANWTSVNPTLAAGEAGYETDTDKLKYGDGLVPWNLLPYFTASGSSPDLSGLATKVELTNHTGNLGNPHEVTKAQVGLSNVPNTDFTSAVAANTAKVSFDSSASTKLAGIQSGAQVNTVTSVASKTGAVNLDKNDVGLGNVDNTTDANKPVSNAAQSALNNKVDKTTTVNGHALSSNVTVSKSDVGLGNVTNDVQLKASNLDTDGTLAANSDTKIASQKATKTYVDSGILAGVDASKPLASAVRPFAMYYSTDINGGTMYISDGSSWYKTGAGANETGGKEIVSLRFGGTATTGTTQVFSSTLTTDVTGSSGSFTMPADGSPVYIKGFLPILVSNASCQIAYQLYVSLDNTNWTPVANSTSQIIAFSSSGFSSGINACAVEARLPVPRFDTSAASPNTLNPGDICYFKLAINISQAGQNFRNAWSASNSYAIADGVSDGTDYYVCKATRSATATHPASDSSYWTKLAVTAYMGYWGFFGSYIDSRMQVVKA